MQSFNFFDLEGQVDTREIQRKLVVKCIISCASEGLEELSSELKVLKLDNLKANFIFTYMKKSLIHLKGTIDVDTYQESVVSLKEVKKHLSVDVDNIYTFDNSATQDNYELLEEDFFYLIPKDNYLSIKEIIREEIGAELDIYPRLINENFTGITIDEKGKSVTLEDNPDNPFLKLKSLLK